jgi:DNA-binding IclR family transcriptional regulator
MNRATGTVERVIAFLTAVAATTGPIKVSSLATALSLPPSTVHRLIGQFVRLGLLKRTTDSRYYEIGFEAFRLGATLSQRLNIVDIAMPRLHRIAQETRESCVLGLHRESDATMFFAAHVQTPEALRYHVDLFKSESVLWGASGRAILAYLSPEMSKVLLEARPVSPTGLHPLSSKRLQNELALIRSRGYSASNRGERVANASGIAVPIFGAHNRIAGCLALTIPNSRYVKSNESKFAHLMKIEAGKLSAELTKLGSSLSRPKSRRGIR